MERTGLLPKLSLHDQALVQAAETAGLLSAAVWANEHLLKAAVVKPGIRYTVWRYEIEALAPKPQYLRVMRWP